MKQAIFVVVALLLQLAAATVVNNNPKTPALAFSPWTSGPIVNFREWNYDVYAAGPVVVSNGTLFTIQSGYTSRLNSVSATNGSSGATFWTTPTWDLVTWMSVKGSTLVIATSDYFAGLNAATGAVLWNNTIVSGYSFSTTTAPLWLDDDCLVAIVGSSLNSKMYHIVAASGASMIMWNSTDLPSGISSYYYPRGPAVLARMNSSLMVVVGFANTFIAINISNASTAIPQQYVAGSSSFSGNTYVPAVVNSTVYFFGGYYTYSSGSGYGTICSYNLATGVNMRYTVPTSQISTATVFNNGSNVGFLIVGKNYSSNCILLSTDLQGNVTGAAGYVSSSDNDCSVLDYGPSEVYVADSDNTIYRYSFGANSFAWSTTSLVQSSFSFSALGTYLNGKLYYATNTYYNGTSNLDGWSVQINTMTGVYETLLPTPMSSSYIPVAFVYDPTSFNGAVVQYGRADSTGGFYDYPYLISRVVAGAAQQATWLAGGAMVGSPVTFDGKVYLFSSRTVYCFGLQNGTLMWSQDVASTIGSFNSVVAGGNLFVPTSSSSRSIYVFDLYNAVPHTMISIPTTVTGCPISTDAPRSFVSDPTKPYVYFSADDGQCLVQFTKVISATTVLGSPTKDSGDVWNAPVLSGDYAYFNDRSGRMYYQRIASFSGSTPLVDYGASLSSAATYAHPSPLAVANGEIYTVSTGAPDKLYRFGAKTLLNDMVGTINSMNDAVPPMTLFKKVYLVLTNGSFVCFPAIPPLLSKNVVPEWVINPNMGSTLGAPVWTNYGVFVFATGSGIFAVDYKTGAINWKITMDQQNRSLTCPGGAIATRTGVAYVQCNMTLYLIDIPKGRIFLTGPQLGSQSTIVVDTSNELNLNILTIAANHIASFNNLTQRLYTPNQLPAPIDGSASLLDLIKNNKIWIAAVVAVVVVLIIIIAVAVKLCGGSKKDTDYVAMQNPVNTGGV